MAYSTAQSCFEAPPNEMTSLDAQTNIALNLSKGLSELTNSMVAEFRDLRTQLSDLRKEIADLKAERRRLVV